MQVSGLFPKDLVIRSCSIEGQSSTAALEGTFEKLAPFRLVSKACRT